MSNERGKNDADDKAKAASQEEQLKKPRILPTPVVCVYILGIIAGAFSFYGACWLNAQILNWGWFFIFIGASFGCAAVRIWIINHRTKHRMPAWLDSNKTFGIIVLACAFACFLAAYLSCAKLKPEPEPPSEDFAIWLSTSDCPDSHLWLTNDFLLFSSATEATNISANLVLPVKSTNSLPALYVALYNQGGLTSPPVKFCLDIDKTLLVDSAGWFPMTRDNLNSPLSYSIEYDVPAITPKMGQGCPPLQLKNCISTSSHWGVPVRMQIIPPDRHDRFVAFFLDIVVCGKTDPPFLIMATNGVVTMPQELFQ